MTSQLDPPRPVAAGTRWTRAHEIVDRFAGSGRLGTDLAEVQDRITAAVPRRPPLVVDAVSGVLTGGKRLRPLLVLGVLYAGPAGDDPAARERALDAATALELIHLASLVHDDVMDEADTRHGGPSVNARVDNAIAVLCGDVLIAAAFAAAARCGPGGTGVVAGAFAGLCAGQALETQDLFNVDRTERDYFTTLAGKTAALFAAAARLGGTAAGLGEATVARLARYGHHLGLVFQVVDDLLDLTGSAAALGKPAGHDIVEGVYTLPVLRARAHRPQLARALAECRRTGHTAPVLDLLRQTPAVGEAEDTATALTGTAVAAVRDCATELRPGGADMLTELARCLTGRTR
ncbi:heptaprenyl diphosphate synthase [Amycolatopsis arida]|uniref:Heptaprenyl diphosphate synthase n=1 Tax=Amycolatopsis arida TaxID=587909 RepID=A0A1I5LW66_9PSEU|nr:polyprenyl synthetase family protein [Amycolatopsis arida]TDX93877.1 heptaprenyl diphosphate synthase [Amycolatopsis arida]SFP01614.1 heptaprenyl diphosphate synthase [Amycolatopsis arida]